MLKKSKIYVAGHTGMVGSAITRFLKYKNYSNLILRTHKQLDLLDQKKTFNFLKNNKPDIVIIAAARVGGIFINNLRRAEFLYKNIQIQNNLIHGSFINNIKKLIFLGSSCIYPKNSKQPIKEEYLLSSDLEKTNEPYAIAKIAGLKMCENYNIQFKTNFLCLMPCNLYGPMDNYHSISSHFFPALINKIHHAKINNKKHITLWGNGKARRELMHVNDLAEAIEFFMKKNIKEHYLNVGSGTDLTIEQYAKKIMNYLNVKLDINYDFKKPNGTRKKLLDSSKAHSYGWKSKTSLESGIHDTYSDYLTRLK